MSQRGWLEESAEHQPLLDEDNSQEEPHHASTHKSTQDTATSGGDGQRLPSFQRQPTRIRRTHFTIVFITLSTMTLHTILQLAGVAKAADVTLVFNYLAMLGYMAILNRAGELL